MPAAATHAKQAATSTSMGRKARHDEDAHNVLHRPVTSRNSSNEEVIRHEDERLEDDEDEEWQGSDADDDEDGDEDEDDEEEDDESEDAEDEPADEEKPGFDEDFLAQLLAMDQMFPASSSRPVQSTTAQHTASQLSTGTGQASAGAPQHTVPFLLDPQLAPNIGQTSQSPSFVQSAPTPSNEFYDGAISFLTEVLGSSNPNIFNSASTPTQGWPPGYSAMAGGTGASPAPTTAQFKNLQPLITNLIARLKGQPLEGTSQPHRISEEDLVMLLQSLMTQRQAQLERKAQGATAWAAETGQSTNSVGANAYLANRSQPFSGGNTFTSGGISAQQAGNAQNQGFSIVDFDFGDDDDDPDFVPSNLNLDYGNSAEFANALASVAPDIVPAAHTMPAQKSTTLSDEDCWRKVLDEFAPAAEAQQQRGHCTRSTSKNGEKQGEGVGQAEDTTSVSSTRNTADGSVSETEGIPKGKRRRFTKEEALARRRKVNRDCARRQRERKKQEAEELRLELERIERLRTEGHSINEEAVNLTLPLLQSRKPGRPLGSKNRPSEDSKASSAAPELKVDQEELLDLRADNRMLRAEMQRLTEENAQLRARILRFNEILASSGDGDIRRRKRMGVYADVDEEEINEIDGHFSSRVTGRREDTAAQFLAYNPFRDKLSGAARALQYGRDEDHARLPGRTKDVYHDSALPTQQAASDRSIAEVAAELVANPRAVERLVATLKQQSSTAGASVRQREHDEVAQRHKRRSSSPRAETIPVRGTRSHNTSGNGNANRNVSQSALHDLLRAATAAAE